MWLEDVMSGWPRAVFVCLLGLAVALPLCLFPTHAFATGEGLDDPSGIGVWDDDALSVQDMADASDSQGEAGAVPDDTLVTEEPEIQLRVDDELALDDDSLSSAEDDSALPMGTEDDTALSYTDETEKASVPIARLTYKVHVQRLGWRPWTSAPKVAGTTGKALRVEALRMRVETDASCTGGIVYAVHVQGMGWQKAVRNGATAGTTGESKRVEALRVKLTGALAKSYDVWYRAYVQRVGWTAWGKNGKDVGSTGLALRMEAVQVCLRKKGAGSPSNASAGTSLACVGAAKLRYRAYVQGIGWQGWRAQPKTAGTTGKNLRIESINVRVDAADASSGSLDGKLQYSVCAQDTGWQGWVSSGPAGRPGSNKRLEAIRMRLSGTLAKTHDLWYRVHVQGIGWMGWARNGAKAGTSTLGRRIEAVQACLMVKGASAPGLTARPYTDHYFRPHMVLVGDSRTVYMYKYQYGPFNKTLYATDEFGNVWSAKMGAGFAWMKSTGVPRVESAIGPDTAVVIFMGTNDACDSLEHSRQYISYLNAKAKQWTKKGASVYYASVGPLGDKPGHNTYLSYSDAENIRPWNNALQRGLSSNIQWLDVYGYLIEDFRTFDGLHYDKATSLRLLKFIRESVE